MVGGDYSSSDPATFSCGTSESGTAPNDSTATAMDAAVTSDYTPPVAKAANHNDSTATATAIDAHKGTPDTSLPTAKGSTPDTSLLIAKGSMPDTSPPSAMDAGKELLATDVEAGKGTATKESLPAIVDPAKGTNPKESLADIIDGSTGKLLASATAAPSQPILKVDVPLPPPKFDIEKAKLLIEQKDWQGLDEQLCQFVDDNTEKKLQDPGIFHPGLVIIAREQRAIQLLEAEEFEVATIYEDMSVSSKKSIGDVDVETAISDYFLLYFRAICQDEADHEVDGPWQFAKKLTSPNKESSPSAKVQRHRPAFSCLACGWTVRGTASISSLRYHISRTYMKKVHPCPKVSQDMLDRLKLTKRKRSSQSSGAAQSSQTPPSLALALAVAPVKKLKSLSSHTVTSSAACPVANPCSRGVDDEYLLEKVDIIQKISTFMLVIKGSVAPSVRAQYVQKARELEKVAYDLKMKTTEDESAPPPVQLPPQTQEETSD